MRRPCTCGACRNCKRRDYYREYEQRRPERSPDQVRASQRRSHLKRIGDPVERMKIAARKAVYRALRSGRLARENCEVCGAEETHAHHDNYDNPLDVRWLCRPHHDELHAQEATTT